MAAAISVHVGPDPLDAAGFLRAFEARACEGSDPGAIASFVGRCRASAGGRRVAALTLDHYPGFTEAEITAIADQAAARFAVDAIAIAHRTGRIAPGETIVVVAAASAHRRAALETVDFLMDYLKTQAPFWKREETDAGAAWIEPRAEDHSDKSRWEDA